MSLLRIEFIRAARVLGMCLVCMATAVAALAQSVSTTTVQGTVYLANGSRVGHTATKLARVHHRIQQRCRCRQDHNDRRRRWICECEPRAEPGFITGRALLHGDLSHERRHNQHGVLLHARHRSRFGDARFANDHDLRARFGQRPFLYQDPRRSHSPELFRILGSAHL